MSTDADLSVVAIVDPYSSGRHLAASWRLHHRLAVAVLSSPAPEHADPLERRDYLGVIHHDGDLAHTAEQLRAHGVTLVVPGCEMGVALADQLAAQLGTPGNPPHSTAARREKPAMAQAAADAGLRVPRTLTAADPPAALAAAAELGRRVVLKPPASAGSDQVYFARHPTQILDAARRILAARNIYGQPNGTVVVQEQLLGQQLIVNTVSVDGAHFITEVWRDRRRMIGGRLVYDRLDLLVPDSPEQRAVADYLPALLDALEIRWGAAHTELMLTDDGPVLIETAARLAGAIVPPAIRYARGACQIDDMIDAYQDPARLIARLQDPIPPLPCTLVFLIAPYDGFIDRGVRAEVLGVPTLAGRLGTLTAEAPVRATVDLHTSPGQLVLVSHDSAEIEADYQRLRAAEQRLYRPADLRVSSA